MWKPSWKEKHKPEAQAVGLGAVALPVEEATKYECVMLFQGGGMGAGGLGGIALS